MALNWQPVPIDFGQGLDERQDPKQVLATSLTQCDNRVFTKAKQLKKDFGYAQLSATADVGGDLTSQTLVGGFTHKNELGVTTKTGAYTYSPSQAKWIRRGQHVPCESYSKNIIKSNLSAFGPQVGFIPGTSTVELHVWCDLDGTISGQFFDPATLSPIGDKTAIVSSASEGQVMCQILDFGSAANEMWIVYSNGNTLYYRVAVTSGTPSIGAENTLNTTALLAYNRVTSASSSGSQSNPLNYPVWQCDANRGDNIMGVFYSSGASYDLRLETFNASGTQQQTAAVATAATFYYSVGIKYEPTNNNWFLCYTDVSGNVLIAVKSPSGGGFTDTVAATDTTYDVSVPHGGIIVGYVVSSTQVRWFFNDRVGGAVTIPAAENNPRVRSFTITTAGAIGSSQDVVGVGGIASFPIQYNSEWYLFISDNENLYLVKPNGSSPPMTIGKMALNAAGAGDASSRQVSIIPPTPYVSSNKIISSSTVISSAQVSLGATELMLDVARFTTDFDIKQKHTETNDVTLFSGGVARQYDGRYFTELGFNQRPVIYKASSYTTTSSANWPFTVAHTNGIPATTFDTETITCCNAQFIQPGQYFTFDNWSGVTDFYVWYTIDGVGTDPAPGGRTAVPVALNGNDSAIEVAYKTYRALRSVGGTSTLNYTGGTQVKIFTLEASGASANVSAGRGNLDQGDYSVLVVWEWTDSQGVRHQSAPSDPLSVTVSAGNTAIKVQVFPLTLTDRFNENLGCQDVSAVMYMTRANGSIYYRVTPVNDPVTNNWSSGTISYLDLYAGQDGTRLGQNESIYTTGGVLSNDVIPPVNQLRVANGRAWGIDTDKNRAIYSKPLVKGEQISFPSEFYFNIGTKDRKLLDIHEMDEKTIFGTEDSIFHTIGDGPDGTGNGAFAEPEVIQAPFGLRCKNTMIDIPEGILLNSTKGIYLLTRGLDLVYLGGFVEDTTELNFDPDKIPLSVVKHQRESQIRFTCASKQIIYDYDLKQWSKRDLTNVSSSCVDCVIAPASFTGALSLPEKKIPYLITSNRVWYRADDTFVDNATAVNSTIVTGWIKMAGLQGYQSVKRAEFLGEIKSDHTFKVEVGYDYASTYAETHTIAFTGSSGRLQTEIQLSNQKCEAIRFRISDISTSSSHEANTLTNMTLLVGIKQGLNKLAYTGRS